MRFRVGWSNSHGWLVIEGRRANEVTGEQEWRDITIARTGKDKDGTHGVNYDRARRIVDALNNEEA